jgi:hypothetical protein
VDEEHDDTSEVDAAEELLTEDGRRWVNPE